MTLGGSSGSGGNKGVPLLGKVIIGSIIPVLALSISFVQLWTGDELVCKLTWDWLKVDFFKCPDETNSQNTQVTSPPKEPITTPRKTANNPIESTPVKDNPINSTTKFDIGVLNGNKEYRDRVSYEIQEKYYFFSIDKNSNVKLYLDGVTSEVWMGLYVDTNRNDSIDNDERLDTARAYSSQSGRISQNLAADRYIVKVQFENKNSDYTIQLVNQTSLTKNIGLLQENKIDKGFLNRDNRVEHYQFNLSDTKNVRLSLSDVTSQVGMELYVDTNGNGVMDGSERLDSASAYSSQAGEIRRNLAPDNYFLVISKEQHNTEYTLNLFLQ